MDKEASEAGSDKEIQYCMVCRVLTVNDLVDVKVLGEAATVVAGNFQDISRQICKKLPRIPLEQQQTLQKSVFKYQSTHMFHILRDGSIVYLCMTPQPIGEAQQTLPFPLLNDVRGHVVRKYRNSIQNIYPDEIYEYLSSYVKDRIAHYHNGGSENVLAQTHLAVDELKATIGGNIDSMIATSQSLDSLNQKAKDLSLASDNFKMRSENVRKQQQKKCRNMFLIYCPIILIIGALIAIFACGGPPGFCGCT